MKLLRSIFLTLAIVSLTSVGWATDFFKDTAQGANDTLLSTHTADFGGTYTNGAGGDPKLDGNGRIKAGTAVGIALISATPPSANYDISVDLVFLNALATDQSWHLILRCSSDGTTRYGLIYDASINSLSLSKVVSGTFTNLQTVAAWTPVVGTTYNYRFSANGTTLAVFRDGSQIGTNQTDSSISTTGQAAIVVQGANTSTSGLRFSNIHVFPTGAASAALAISTPTANSTGATTVTATASAATGGIPSYTYQWYRSTTTGFTPGGGNIVSGATSLTLNDTGLTTGTTYFYKIIATDASAATVTSAQTSATPTASSLVSGTISESSHGITTATLVATTASGGTAPLTYQWHRSTTNGFTPGGGTAISGATAATSLSDTGLTGGTTYYYKLVTTDAASATVTSNQLTVTTNSGTISVSSITVPSTGIQLNVTFSGSLGTTVNPIDWQVTVAGVPVTISSVTGSGTTRQLILASPRVIGSGQVVKASYVGSAVVPSTTTATNSSTLTAGASKFILRGFGIFIHWSSATFTTSGAVTQSTMNTAFNPTSYNMDQWLDAVQACGARYVVLTTKHDGGFCLWPTATGAPNIGATPWYTTNQIDVVRDFTTKCRARGLGVGLYINFYDPYYTGLHSGTYTPQATYTAYITAQITELLSNYGQIDMLWTDSWSYQVTYTNAPYSTILASIRALQPNCVLVNNDHTGDLSHSDIAVFEGDGVQAEPTGNIQPAEFCENARSDIQWVWQASGENSYKDPYALAARIKRLTAQNATYLLNFPPNNLGLLPTSNVTFATTLGTILGTQGSAGTPVLPPPTVVKSGTDRGDGFIGTYAPARAVGF